MDSLFIQTRKQPAFVALNKFLLICGVLSSLLYVVANVVTAMQYPGYNTSSQTVSELSAIDTPTRSLWVLLMAAYSLLVIAFAIGVWRAASNNRRLQVVAALLIADAVIGFFWPPMHQREVLAAGGGTLTDTLHIVFTLITIPLLIMIIVFGGVAFGKSFLFYSIATLVVLIFFG